MRAWYIFTSVDQRNNREAPLIAKSLQIIPLWFVINKLSLFLLNIPHGLIMTVNPQKMRSIALLYLS